eukprot:CAMPEP_0175815776 /NCGR_PEP_ID=MMETSP0107_2-20121207/6147_1 /TAXON_ID=195067 ORGANISM="Goniomonas pacifica, Strain CCMP1869" /NCGR_SAMPLE_ID=MMETSP0107_2 /ASSEMBLY_ACC=CAM_ASM_000203 /LENGTH=94 /DNA_ID=CAMNT_0017127841 /DNA_START=139 /DNA_END=419 /DNA_ORIENTATION=+
MSTPQPTLTTPLIPCCAPSTILHRTDESERHVVSSHPLPPTRTLPLYSCPPSPSPANVTLADPVCIPFVRVIPLTIGSNSSKLNAPVNVASCPS